MASRRAYRPDRHIYRDLRRRSRRGWSWNRVLGIGLILLITGGGVGAMIWWLFH